MDASGIDTQLQLRVRLHWILEGRGSRNSGGTAQVDAAYWSALDIASERPGVDGVVSIFIANLVGLVGRGCWPLLRFRQSGVRPPSP